MNPLRFLLWAVRGLRPMKNARFARWLSEDPTLTVERTQAVRGTTPTEAKP
jgi:hypothetical protein